jgi:hypothetical protein
METKKQTVKCLACKKRFVVTIGGSKGHLDHMKLENHLMKKHGLPKPKHHWKRSLHFEKTACWLIAVQNKND